LCTEAQLEALEEAQLIKVTTSKTKEVVRRQDAGAIKRARGKRGEGSRVLASVAFSSGINDAGNEWMDESRAA
jgi:hypothetical protein